MLIIETLRSNRSSNGGQLQLPGIEPAVVHGIFDSRVKIWKFKTTCLPVSAMSSHIMKIDGLVPE